jgi:hypothetical protein
MQNDPYTFKLHILAIQLPISVPYLLRNIVHATVIVENQRSPAITVNFSESEK